MEIGASIFFTEYAMGPTELAVALEQRGFDSLWVAEPSHNAGHFVGSPIPLAKRR
jgi:alkanesulfonate monooxygenase SsuD/methylene tetrahydromethanopterin reductase-like flavin-dependent oxidoreductase (luciferase family)